MHDTCGRKIDYLRISVTDLCNLRCKYCIPEKGVPLKQHDDILTFEEIQRVVQEAAMLGVTKVRITGGEPLVRRGIADLIRLVAAVPGIRDIGLTTNGVLLAEQAVTLKAAGLHRVNISLDTLDPAKYREITRGGDIELVLAGIREARRIGLTPIKINAVLIGGFNDGEIESFVALTRSEPIDVRFIELMPIGEASTWSSEHFISNETVLERMPALAPLADQDGKSPARYYALPDALGKVGLINPISSHFCASCNRLRLTADGKLKPCLNADTEISLKEALRGKGSLGEQIRKAVSLKPESHDILGADYKPVTRNMHEIGG